MTAGTAAITVALVALAALVVAGCRWAIRSLRVFIRHLWPHS